MVGKTKPATAEQRRRMARIKDTGCILCKEQGHRVPCEVHHITDCGRRIGHDATIGLCAWHHRGVPPGSLRPSQAEVVWGPSLARSKKQFVQRYGTELEILERQNRLIA